MPPTLRIEMGLSPLDGFPHSSNIKVFVDNEQIGMITNIRFTTAAHEVIPQLEIDLPPPSLISNGTPQLQAAYSRYQALLQPFMSFRSPPAPPEPPRPVCPTAWERLNLDD